MDFIGLNINPGRWNAPINEKTKGYIMTKNNNKPVETLCLCRVSSDKQAKNETITSQKQACINYAKYNGFIIDQFFYEDGVSGWKTNRPGLDAMVEYIEREQQHKHIRILCYDMSRLARNLGVYAQIEQVIIKYDLELQTVIGGKTENNANGRFLRGLEILQARRFSDELSEKTTGSMRALCTLGFYPLNPPLGLKRIKNENNRTILVRDEPKASIIYEAFAKYASGELGTKHDVTEFLRASDAFRGVKLNDTKVNGMLKNEIYTGIFAYEHWGIERQEWKMDKIIPLELFQAVQRRMARNARAPYKSDVASEFPLRNEIYCQHCGKPLTGYFAKSRNGAKHPYYRCFNRKCPEYNNSIRRRDVHQAFENALCAINMPDGVANVFVSVLKHVCANADKENISLRLRWQRELEELNQKIEQLITLIGDTVAKGDSGMREIYEERLHVLVEQKNDLQQRIEACRPLATTDKFQTAIQRGCDFFKNPIKLWLEGTLSQKKRLVRLIFTGKPAFCRENGFQTATTPWIFNKKSAQMDGKSDLAAPTGFEPVFSP